MPSSNWVTDILDEAVRDRQAWPEWMLRPEVRSPVPEESMVDRLKGSRPSCFTKEYLGYLLDSYRRGLISYSELVEKCPLDLDLSQYVEIPKGG